MINILNQAKTYSWTSLSYVDLEDIIDFEKYPSSDLILLHHMKDDIVRLHYAAHDVKPLVLGIKEIIKDYQNFSKIKLEYRIEFIPIDWVKTLEEVGFMVSSHFVDYWLKPLKKYHLDLRSELIIRDLQTDEYEAFAKITQENKLLSRGYYGEPHDFAQTFLSDAHTKIYTAKLDNKIVGVCATKIYNFEHKDGPVLWLREVAVKPTYHQKGIGQSIMTYALNMGYDLGARQSFLACDCDNRQGIKLYEKLGYQKNNDPGQINMILYQK
jgi:ribosomal protein S18 acetylase RimI-like enzyme